MRQESPEFPFVDALFIGFFWRNSFHADVFHDGVVEGLIPDFLADLDHARNLMRLALAHQVGNGRGEDQDFKGRHAALLVDPLEKVLSNDAFESFGERRANLVLLLGWEDRSKE